MIIPAYTSYNVYSRMACHTTALGPITTATCVKEIPCWDVEVIDENNTRLYAPKMSNGQFDHLYLQNSRRADIVGLYGGLSSTVKRLYQLAKFYKEQEAITIAGGQHFAQENIEEALNSGVDIVVVGEGEDTIAELIDVLVANGELSKVKGIAYMCNGQMRINDDRPAIKDFDKYPLPDFSLLRYAKLKVYPVGRIRGCGMNCEFCTVKGNPRCASVERLLESIMLLVETRKAKHFFIVDDLFGQQRIETIEFCNKLEAYQKRIGKRLSIRVQIRLDKGNDDELLDAMRRAGIYVVAIGYESPIAQELEAMNKHIDPQQMISLSRRFSRYGFLIHGMFIFAYPLREGMEFNMDIKQRAKIYKDFIRKIKLDSLQVLLAVPLPGTELRKRLQKDNRIYPKEIVGWEFYDGNFPLFEPDQAISNDELHRAIKSIMSSYYRFNYMFAVALQILSFPTILFYLHNIRPGWNRWYRAWRNSLIRFSGWQIMHDWNKKFKTTSFNSKVKSAQAELEKIK